MSKSLRILFLSREFPPETGWGGIGSYTACITSYLAKRGHEVHVLSCCIGQKKRDYEEKKVFIHRRGELYLPGLSRIGKFLGISSATIVRIRTGLSTLFEYYRLGVNFDVIEYPDFGAEGWLFAFLGMKPLIASLHGPLFFLIRSLNRHHLLQERESKLGNFLEHFAVHNATIITAPSEYLIDNLKSYGWLKRDDIKLIPPPIDRSNWKTSSQLLDTLPIVLFIGRLDANKAPEVLVKAMTIIRRQLPEAKAIFIGKDSMPGQRPYLNFMREQCLCNFDGCEFIDHVPYNNVSKHLSQARVVAIPSWLESYSIVALEAMAAGKPVVITSTTGIAKLIARTGAGKLVAPGNSEALADALLLFLKDAAYAEKIGKIAELTVREIADPYKIAEKREKAYYLAIQKYKMKKKRRERNKV